MQGRGATKGRRLKTLSELRLGPTMKKFLLIAAALAAMALPAQADSLPKEALGKWCAMDNEDQGATWDRTYFGWFPDPKCNPDTIITITNKRWGGLGGLSVECSFTSVRTRFDRSIIRNTKEMGVNVAHISAQCSNEDCSYRSEFVVYFSQGILTMRGRNSQKKCDGD